MRGMTTQDRYDDICKISGLSEDIVRRVLLAEKQSIIESLKHGERATLIGRCVIRPEIRSKIVIGGKLKNYVKLSVAVADSLECELKSIESFEGNDDVEEDCGIRLQQIRALT